MAFFQYGLVIGHSHTVSPQLDLATLSSVSLVPPSFFPCPDANGVTNLLVIGSSEFLPSRLPRTSQRWEVESTKFKVMKGYWTIIEAKPLRPVDKTFSSFPTDGANCCYLDCLNSWASIAQCEPAKGAIRWWCTGRLSDD